jgi:hypothetical protein
MDEIIVTPGKTTNVGTNTLTPTVGTITGTITDAALNPLHGAEVTAVPRESSGRVTSITNASGEYTITVPAGSYRLFVRASSVGYATVSSPVLVAAGQAVPIGTTHVAHTVGAISGTITDDKGAPISGATVKTVQAVFLTSFSENTYLSCVTNGAGEYTIVDVPEGGPYGLEVTAPGYANNEAI